MSNQSLLSKVAIPYAEALLESAQENNLIKNIGEDLSAILNILSESNDLKIFLDNPLITPLLKKDVLNKLLLNQVNDFVLRFLLVLIDRRRISLINVVAEKYLELSYKLESTVVAEVSTAVTLTEAQQENLIKKLKDLTGSHQVKLLMHIDTELIAGFTVKIGSRVIDASLSGKLKQIAFYLNNK
uniref:ATP synthase CF1 delta subunit n=1 Tax=Rhodymenia pseudopalmata TaxID=31502 RepID=A0A1C9C7G6_RHOPU|nr:ATP synthase CF1 delta subunit [Rhodymenia pseudopalmata]AOM64323.1 ATP synthase CF1 delta subunit [Rhodymenia pseudopalmata]